nr:serine-arginine protein 55-like [Leptinotarsa decemlineata]
MIVIEFNFSEVEEEVKYSIEKFIELDTSIGSTSFKTSTSDSAEKRDGDEEDDVLAVSGVDDRLLCFSRGLNLAPVRTQHKLIVRNLSFAVSWQDLKDYMRNAGRVTFGQAHTPYRNIGTVEFASHSDMEAAFRQLNHTVLKGQRIRLEKARIDSIWKKKHFYNCASSLPFQSKRFSKPTRSNHSCWAPIRTPYRLLISNVSDRVSWQDLKDHMRNSGNVTFAEAHNLHRNMGVVDFASKSDLQAAYRQLNGTLLKGRRICLDELKIPITSNGVEISAKVMIGSPKEVTDLTTDQLSAQDELVELKND